MLNKVKQRKESGFTIIEVMIVLAIAALIMVVVFLAVPALERSSRNTQRKTDANNALSALSDYVSNNGGALPSANCADAGTTTGKCAFLTNTTIGYFKTANISYVASFPATAPSAPDSEHVVIYGGGTCSSAAAAPTAATSTRSIAVYYGIEGNPATQCISE